jgi:methyl-accepting chemotaxis protein
VTHQRRAGEQPLGVPAMKAAEQITEAESAFRASEAFRSRLDDDLAKPGSGRALQVVEGFSPAITNLIDVDATLRLPLETLTSPPTVALTQLVHFAI